MKRFIATAALALAGAAHAGSVIDSSAFVQGVCYAEYQIQHGANADFYCTMHTGTIPRNAQNVVASASSGDPDVAASTFEADAFNTGPLGLSGDGLVTVGVRLTNTSKDRNVLSFARINIVLVRSTQTTQTINATQGVTP